MPDYKLFKPDFETAKAQKLGFRFGARGTHTSRTMMLDDLTAVLSVTAADAARDDYIRAIIDDNCLGKQTVSTRRLSKQRMAELYALDPAVPLFAALRYAWEIDRAGRPLIAFLCAVARDPMLAATIPSVLPLAPGAEFRRDDMRFALRQAVGERLSDSILDKVVRNAGSSWTQSGHLEGRTFKRRQRVQPTPGAVAYALYLAHIAGFRGMDLFSSGWLGLLDCAPALAQDLSLEAKRMQLLDLRISGNVVAIRFPQMDPAYEGE